MSISSAINNAMSGLGMVSRSAEIVSRNVANAKVSGYSRLEVQTAQNMLGGEGAGVSVKGVTRATDPFLTAARMRSEAGSEKAMGEADAYRAIANLVNDPKGGDSLQKRFQDLDNGLRALADTPESSAIRQTAASAAGALADRFNAISTQARQMRVDADQDIQRQVKIVNTALKRIEGLNGEIEQAMSNGRDPSALQDERQRQLDVVNKHVPIKAKGTGRGSVMVTTETGAMLVQGKAAQLSFEPTGAVTGYNQLNGLGLNDSNGDPSIVALNASEDAPGEQSKAMPFYFQGGALEAAFIKRDEITTDFIRNLDDMAAGLMDRMQKLPGFEAEQTVGDGLGDVRLGLFADVKGGTQIRLDETADPVQRQGLAERIQLFREVDPRNGGDAKWLGAEFDAAGKGLQPSASSQPLHGALYAAFKPQAATQTTPAFDGFVKLSAEFGAAREGEATGPETDSSYKAAALSAVREQEVASGAVDTDREMQDLLELEKSYSANARVMQVANQMIQTLLESV